VISVRVHQGLGIQGFVDYIAELRISTFKEFPYLYKGDILCEKKYIEEYIKDARSMLSLIYVNKELAGFLTGMPLSCSADVISHSGTIFRNKGIDPSIYYYYGEMIVLPNFRNLRLPSILFASLDREVKNMLFTYTCFLTVVRDDDHPMRPDNYKDTSHIWYREGYKKMNITTEFNWPQIQSDGSVKEESSVLEYWSKKLETIPDLKSLGA